MSWHWIDYVIFVIIGISVITGLFRGFVKELIALVVWILAIWLAYSYSHLLNTYLMPYLHDDKVRAALSFVAILLATLLAGAIVNALLSFILKRSGLSGTDRLLGMGFGLVRGIFIVGLIMLMVKISGLPSSQYTEQSRIYAKFDPLVNWMNAYVPGFIEQVKDHELLDKPDKESSQTPQVAFEQIGLPKHFDIVSG